MHKAMAQLLAQANPELTAASLAAAKVHPESGLATDFLNPFNEYVMLAQMAEDDPMARDMLLEWQPIDYEGHFAGMAFAGADIVLAAYRALPSPHRRAFEAEVNTLIEAIFAHRAALPHADIQFEDVRCHLARVAAIISGADAASGCQKDRTQADIDMLFD